MIRMGAVMGHNALGDIEKVSFIIPKNLELEYPVISTLWNSETSKGQTLRMLVPSKSYWDLDKNPPILLGKHKSEKKAIEFHDKTVREIRKDDRYV